MNCHCPPEYYDTHISLYYNGFDDFLAKRNSLDIGQDDINLTTTICGLMSRAYENEEERMKTVFLDSCIKDYFTMGSSSIQLYLRNIWMFPSQFKIIQF